jgi:hypothetical protein
LVGIWGSITSKKANHFIVISPCLRSFQKLVEDYMAFWIVLQLGYVYLLQERLVQPHSEIQRVGHSCSHPQKIWRRQLSRTSNLPIEQCCGTITPLIIKSWNF